MRTCPFEAERNKFPLQGVRDLTWGEARRIERTHHLRGLQGTSPRARG